MKQCGKTDQWELEPASAKDTAVDVSKQHHERLKKAFTGDNDPYANLHPPVFKYNIINAGLNLTVSTIFMACLCRGMHYDFCSGLTTKREPFRSGTVLKV